VSGSYTVGGDNHALYDGLRVSLEDRTIHKGARISFIAVANHIFRGCLCLQSGFPFASGRETATTPSPQAGIFDDINNLLRGVVLENMCQGLITIHRKIITDIFRIDRTASSKNYPGLAIVEGNIVLGCSSITIRIFEK